MKSCKQLIEEFNIAASVIPVAIHHKIMNGESFSADDCEDRLPECKVAVQIWNELQQRLRDIPQYDLMVQ